MKNIFKTQALILFMIIFSCSDNEDNNEIEEIQYPSTSELITTIKSLNRQPWETDGDLFIYDDGQLKFSFFEGCGTNQYYEYTSVGKISKIFSGQHLDREAINLESFDVEDYKNSIHTSEQTYSYSNGLLNEIAGENYIFYHTYDGQKRLKTIEQYHIYFNEYDHKWTINYDVNGSIENLVRDNLRTGNTTIYTYEFDDKKNPLYILYTKFSLVSLETCRALDYNTANGYFFENNVTKIFENDILTYSATYEYENEMPLRVSWVDYKNDRSNVELYAYEILN